MLDILKSMHGSVKTRNKYNNKLSEDFICCFGVRQG